MISPERKGKEKAVRVNNDWKQRKGPPLFTAMNASQVEEALGSGHFIEHSHVMVFKHPPEKGRREEGNEDEEQKEKNEKRKKEKENERWKEAKIECEVTTPLLSACQRGLVEVVDCLLKHGANPNHSPSGCLSISPFQMASTKGHSDIVRRLVEAGAKNEDIKTE